MYRSQSNTQHNVRISLHFICSSFFISIPTMFTGSTSTVFSDILIMICANIVP